MRKILGYLLSLIGVLGVAIVMVPQLDSLVPLPTQFKGNVLLVISLAVALIGIYFIAKGGKPKTREVPILAGKNIVGYRVIKTK